MKTGQLILASSLAVAFLVSVGVQAGPPPASSPEMIEKGKASYAMNCLMCHGEKYDGNGPAGAAMNPKPRNLVTEKFKAGEKPEQVFKTMTVGLKGTSMAGYSHLPEAERWALVHFMASLKAKK